MSRGWKHATAVLAVLLAAAVVVVAAIANNDGELARAQQPAPEQGDAARGGRGEGAPGGPPGQPAMPPAPVAVEEVVVRPVRPSRTYLGTVLPTRTSVVGSAVDGRVIDFPVNHGQFVRAGETLAQLRTDTLMIELAAARAQLELRRHELAELENGSRPEEIEQARARMASAEAQREYTRSVLARTQDLFDEGRIASEESLEEAGADARAAEEAYAEAYAAYQLAEAGPRQEEIAQARAAFEAQEEAVRLIEDQLAKHTIVAPFDGYVVAEHTEEGEWVMRGDPVAEVVELTEVDIQVHVPEFDARWLRVGDPARFIEVSALPGETFGGQIAQIIPQADLRARTLPVRVRVENRPLGAEEAGDSAPTSTGPSPWAAGALLRAGMTARVTLDVGLEDDLMLVPKDAVVISEGSPARVFVVDLPWEESELGQARPVVVETGPPVDDWIAVTGELHPGQLVVVRGNERLLPGQPVEVLSEE